MINRVALKCQNNFFLDNHFFMKHEQMHSLFANYMLSILCKLVSFG